MRKTLVEQAIDLKLRALVALGRYLGFWRSPYRLSSVEPLRGTASPDLLAFWLLTAINQEAAPTQRAASMLLLDFHRPGWRRHLSLGLLGFIVERTDRAVARWRAAVFARDGYQCRGCGALDGLEAHHLVPWALAPALRVVVANGLTLCGACHLKQRDFGTA